jgi:YggT family protein
MIRRLTEPVYSYIRKYIPTNFNGIDFAPVVLLIGLQFIDLFLVRVLMHLAESLK